MSIREFTFVPVRRPKGMVSVRLAPKDKDDIFKDRAVWLLEALGAYHSRRAGYCLTPAKAEIFAKLYRGGWSGSMRLAVFDKRKRTFSRGDGPEMSLKKALEVMENEEEHASDFDVSPDMGAKG